MIRQMKAFFQWMWSKLAGLYMVAEDYFVTLYVSFCSEERFGEMKEEEKKCFYTQHEVSLYGTRSMYRFITKTVLLFTLAVLLDIACLVVLFFIVYCTVRVFSYGAHLRSNLGCTLWGLVYYLGGTYLALHTSISMPLFICIFVISFLSFFLYAPAETYDTPVSSDRNGQLKLMSLLATFIWMSFSFVLYKKNSYVLSNVITFAVAAQAINVLPITYFIFKVRRESHGKRDF